jgi:ADP-ribosylglycohydrolase
VIRCTFLGLAVGDALGRPVEGLLFSLIEREFGRITNYFNIPNHEDYDGQPPGTCTDDTQLSLAVARAFIQTGQFDLDAISEEHCAEFHKSVAGWGVTTTEAVARIVNGTHWSQAAHTDKPRRGTGNGVAMKVAPVGLYMALSNPTCAEPHWTEDIDGLAKLATMTHGTCMAVTSGWAQAFAVLTCFRSEPETFNLKAFVRAVTEAGSKGRRYLSETITGDDLGDRLGLLERHEEYMKVRIVNEFRGSAYAFESLPFTLMFFVLNPRSIDALFDVVSSGGDADTNGSMIGALLGALHGTGVFPPHLVDGLRDREAVIEVADEFFEKFSRT